MKKVYWTNGTHNDGKGWYSEINERTCDVLIYENVIGKQGNDYICLNSKRFVEIAKNDLMHDDPKMGFAKTMEAKEERINSNSSIYANPGKTLKSIAVAMFIIGCIAYAVIGIAVAELSYDFNALLFAGILIIGIIISYLVSLVLAALGDLVMNVNAINKKIK